MEDGAVLPLFLHFVLGKDVLTRHYVVRIDIISHLAYEC